MTQPNPNHQVENTHTYEELKPTTSQSASYGAPLPAQENIDKTQEFSQNCTSFPNNTIVDAKVIKKSSYHSEDYPSLKENEQPKFYSNSNHPQNVKFTPFFSQPTPKLLNIPISQHTYSLALASIGLSHINQKNPIPCQDSVKAELNPRPILIACDGAGSSVMSDIGSLTLCTQLSRFCQTIEPVCSSYLDESYPHNKFEDLVKMIYHHAIGTLIDLSKQHRRDIKDFRSTLNFVIVGQVNVLWIKVGDGEIIQETIQYYDNEPNQFIYQLHCLGEHAKGEFANQTQFIDEHLKFNDVQWGVLDRKTVHGIVLMSDGASEKLVSINRDKVAGQVRKWLYELRQNNLKAGELAKRFYSDDFTKRSTGDDRSIVLWVQNID